MGTAAMPSGPSGVLHTGNAWSADVRLGGYRTLRVAGGVTFRLGGVGKSVF